MICTHLKGVHVVLPYTASVTRQLTTRKVGHPMTLVQFVPQKAARSVQHHVCHFLTHRVPVVCGIRNTMKQTKHSYSSISIETFESCTDGKLQFMWLWDRLFSWDLCGKTLRKLHRNGGRERSVEGTISTVVSLRERGGDHLVVPFSIIWRSAASILSPSLPPWYNRNGWLGVKHQVTNSLPFTVNNRISRVWVVGALVFFSFCSYSFNAA